MKAALHAVCGKVCEQLQSQSNVSIDKKVVAAIGDLTFQQIGTFCQDLDAFAKYESIWRFFVVTIRSFRHGKRTTINSDDVRLLCRRNPGLLDKIDDYQRASKPTKSTNRSTSNRTHISSRYDDHNVDITAVESSSDIDDIN